MLTGVARHPANNKENNMQTVNMYGTTELGDGAGVLEIVTTKADDSSGKKFNAYAIWRETKVMAARWVIVAHTCAATRHRARREATQQVRPEDIRRLLKQVSE